MADVKTFYVNPSIIINQENNRIVTEGGTPPEINEINIGDLTGDITGDIKASDGTTVIESGTDGSDARYRGDVYSEMNDLVLDSGTDGTNATFVGDIYATDGTSLILDSGTDGTDAIFNGVADSSLELQRFTSDTDATGEDTRVVYLQQSEYNALWSGGTPGSGTFSGDSDTLYLIRM